LSPKQEADIDPKEERTLSPEISNGRNSLSPQELAPSAEHNQDFEIQLEHQSIRQ